MKLSNFALEKVEGDSALNKKFFASVDVTTGFIFKKTEKKSIMRKYGGRWVFVETGEYTPTFQAESLARSWSAKTGQEV